MDRTLPLACDGSRGVVAGGVILTPLSSRPKPSRERRVSPVNPGAPALDLDQDPNASSLGAGQPQGYQGGGPQHEKVAQAAAGLQEPGSPHERGGLHPCMQVVMRARAGWLALIAKF